MVASDREKKTACSLNECRKTRLCALKCKRINDNDFNADYLCYRTCMKKNSEKLNGNKLQSCNLFLAFNDCDRSLNVWY